jgi:hypothetical protein
MYVISLIRQRHSDLLTASLPQPSRTPRPLPHLTDVHILFSRPGTQSPGTVNPIIDPLTIRDVASIFRCNGNISRVGIGNSLVWERAARDIALVSDGSDINNAAVPRFYHAGYAPGVEWTNGFPRLKRASEIEQLRDLLKRILD